MNYRKLIILPAFFLLSHFLYISCCKCVDAKEHFYEVINIFVQAKGSGNAVVDSGAITHVDTLYLNYSINNYCVAGQKNPLAFLVNEGLACKCTECGLEGLKSKIQSIEISSDSIYNGIPANSLLNNFFQVSLNGSFVSVDSLKNAVNNNQYRLYGLSMFTTTKPANNKGHVFMLKLIFANGSQVTSSTSRIYWS